LEPKDQKIRKADESAAQSMGIRRRVRRDERTGDSAGPHFVAGGGPYNRAGLDYLLKENDDPSSVFYKHLSIRAGVSGHCFLADDRAACAMFRGGSSCGVCKDPNWTSLETRPRTCEPALGFASRDEAALAASQPLFVDPATLVSCLLPTPAPPSVADRGPAASRGACPKWTASRPTSGST
jgi:hypothetical protein